MEYHLKIIGYVLIALATIHIFFPKYFQWEKELKSLSLMNRQMMQVHTFFIALFVFLNGLLCLVAFHELEHTYLGSIISIGLGVFWFARLIFQVAVYSPKLWRGKTFETTTHIVFTLLWMYITGVFFILVVF